METNPQFSKLRNLLWPIAAFELRKFIPMVVMIFLIAANYNILKIIKDSTVIPAAGAEVIPFIKVWMLLPMAVVVTAFFSYLVQKFNENKAFYIVIGAFLFYFGVFVFLIYPNRETFYLDTVANIMEGVLPSGLKGLASLVRYWHLCLFYTMCEIWGTTVLFVLFWGFANRITVLHEAKRFYALFGLAGNSSGIVAPLFFNWASSASFLPEAYLKTQWEQSLAVVCFGVLLSGFITIGIFYYLNRFILVKNETASATQQTVSSTKKKKERKSFLESMKIMSKDPYVRNLTIVVLSYNIVINLTEVLWKAQIKSLYPNQLEYGLYFGKVMMVTGVIATLSDLLLCSNVIRKFGWTCAAMVTPMILLVTSIGFFGFLMFDSYFESFLVHLLGMTPLAMTTLFGSMQNALSRAAKYSLFDATKEISYIPLDAQSRIQAKAAIDGVCSRLGKSGGSIVYQCLLGFCGSLTACVPYVAAIVGSLMFFWISAVSSMGKRFKMLTEHQTQDDRLDSPSAEPLPKDAVTP